ncbi:hypothetical protein BP6252_08908 [Coleophoma cylindrospora]|uniref:DUF1479-domain-containing protein n=1 Tax=Coleophoma cylindrospora TaxID=1849047 RepID=A0A3D8R0D0_9HELO|nr:hypothetical protein BP6252_08908 [Coleophoma cylindrospora]
MAILKEAKVSSSGKLSNWPAWEEFTYHDDASGKDTGFSKVKREIIAEFGADALREAWLKTCAELEKITDEIARKGTGIIPVFDFADVMHDDAGHTFESEIKRTGCCIIRGVIDESEATQMYHDLKEFVHSNKDHITGWPAEAPYVLNLCNTPVQVNARVHPNQLAIQHRLNQIWHDVTKETSPSPLLYADAVRIRPPGKELLGLGPHIDAGNFCRWEDGKYRLTYSAIFSGHPEDHDCYDLTTRKDANQTGHSTVLRAFQGWTAFTRAGPREGSLLIVPNVQWTISYVLLRPFFSPPETDVLDAHKWTFNPDGDWFPGTSRQGSQKLSPNSHPHLRLKESLVNIPVVNPGDTVWWHADMCHAVEPEHSGSEDSCVVYIAATPRTKINNAYMTHQLAAIQSGQLPIDFLTKGIDEFKLRGYTGLGDLSSKARSAMGYDL